jgi:hypothetical protein
MSSRLADDASKTSNMMSGLSIVLLMLHLMSPDKKT